MRSLLRIMANLGEAGFLGAASLRALRQRELPPLPRPFRRDLQLQPPRPAATRRSKQCVCRRHPCALAAHQTAFCNRQIVRAVLGYSLQALLQAVRPVLSCALVHSTAIPVPRHWSGVCSQQAETLQQHHMLFCQLALHGRQCGATGCHAERRKASCQTARILSDTLTSFCWRKYGRS